MRHLQSELLLALIKTVMSERFAALIASVTGVGVNLPLFYEGVLMENINCTRLITNMWIIFRASLPMRFTTNSLGNGMNVNT